MNFVREKKYICGDYVEIDIVHYSTEQEQRLARCKKQKVSRPSQQNLNENNSRRFFRMQLNANFGKEDYHVSLTYDEEHYPPDDEIAFKEIRNYVRRLKGIYKKAGVEFKYILVTEYGHKRGRIHHHLVVSGGVPREVIENAWGRGYANVDRLQPDKEDGFAALAKYLTKNPQGGRHRWSCSRNLKKPVVQINDNAYSLRAAAKAANDIIEGKADGLFRLQKRYKHFQISSARVQINPVTNTKSIYIMARRI